MPWRAWRSRPCKTELALIQHASERLDALLATTTKMLDAQNMTRPMAFALQTTKIKLEADRADTQSKIAAIYAPPLSDRPVKELIAEKQRREANQQKAVDRVNRQNDWDVALSVGAHQQVNPLVASNGAYGEVTVSYNLASHAINKHLDQAADAYDDWKKVQEGDVARNADILKQQLVDGNFRPGRQAQPLQQEEKQIESNLQLLGTPEPPLLWTSATSSPPRNCCCRSRSATPAFASTACRNFWAKISSSADTSPAAAAPGGAGLSVLA